MRYIQAGFVGEGPTDYEFLAPLMRRVLGERLYDSFDGEFEVPDLVHVLPGDHYGNQPDAVVSCVQEVHSYVDLLFYHTDAGGHLGRAYETRVVPVECGLAGTAQVIGVVPRREMEAWVVADSEALAEVLGLGRLPVSGFPSFHPSKVESISDPKQELRDFLLANGGRRFQPVGESFSFYSSLALTVNTEELMYVPQFSRLVDDLDRALVQMELQ